MTLPTFSAQEIYKNISFRHQLDQGRNVRDTDRDCGSTFCKFDFKFLPTCTIYVDESPTETCNYPCSLDHCLPEIHHFIQCPTWSCFDKTTTVAPIPMSTLKPATSHSDCSSAFCITSVTVNVILIVVAVLIGIFLKKRSTRQATHSLENPMFDDSFDHFSNDPIIRRSGSRFSEHVPLLRVGDNRPPSLERSATLPNPPGGSVLGASVASSTSTVPLTPTEPGLSLHFSQYTASAPVLHFNETTF